MATISSQMTLNDGVSSVLRKISSALDTTLHSFEQVQRASGQAIDASSIDQASSALAGANVELEEMEKGYRQAAEQAESLDRRVRSGSSSVSSMLGKVKSLAATMGMAVGLGELVNLSDQMTSTKARLNLIVDDGGSVTELERKIMASAQRTRSAYMDTAAAIAKLGSNASSAFSGNDELIAFMEQVNKQFVIGGATAQEQSNAMTQLTQAMAAGALRGEELNSILDSAPGIARAIEQYMGAAEGSIKQLASEGLVTSTVVKNALFSVADETNAKFASMPMTWAQVWTMASNIALQALSPVLTAINWLANNISIIGPLLLGLGAAFLVFQVAAHWTQIATFATAAYNAVVSFLSIGYGVLTGSATAATAAQSLFNSALLASPITWIIMLIVILIGLLYGVVAIINKVTGSSISATGLICGAIAVAGAFVINLVIGVLNAIIQFIWSIFVTPFLGIVEWILNVCNGGFTSFGGAVANLIGQIISWFLSLGKVVTTIIDAIFGTNWTAGLSSLQNAVTSWGKSESAVTLDYSDPPQIDRVEYGGAWDSGYDFGAGIADTVGGMFSFGGESYAGTDDYATGLGYDLGSINDTLGGIGDSAGRTAGNTGSMAESLEISSEQLEYLRDIAEREAINRFTTAEVKIDMTGMTNRIDGSVDLDGVLTELTDGFAEALVVAAEGVHA